MSKHQATERAKVIIERSYRAELSDIWELWTTKEGFESWWGPQGFRVEVSEMDARVGGALRYEMIAATAEMVHAMKKMGQGPSHAVSSSFSELVPLKRLVLTSIIDFLPGVDADESQIIVEFSAEAGLSKMVVHLDTVHSEEMTKMQKEGFESQLTKLDERYGKVDS
jgi:uncharacterized protein YndB with AHSA1/START domain